MLKIDFFGCLMRVLLLLLSSSCKTSIKEVWWG
jgi:hypothetical protein